MRRRRSRSFVLLTVFSILALIISVLVSHRAGVSSGFTSVAESVSPSTMANAHPDSLIFATHIDYNVGIQPVAVAVGDFNRDGIPDLATANFGGNDGGSVSVRLGTASGSFGPATNYADPNRPNTIAVGDFNHDGIPDIVVGDSADSVVSVLLGNGDGTFGSAVSFPVSGSSGVAIGDFNRDGIPDLATTDFSHPHGTVSVLLGLGKGSFGTYHNYEAGFDPLAMVAADFNRDGKLDLAISTDDGISILLGVGDGSFGPSQNFSAGNFPISVAAGDFNRDGIPDLVVANYDGRRPIGGVVTVLLGKGNGSFGAPRSFSSGGTGPYSVAVGDLNRDGISDIVVANIESGNVSVLLGVGDGSFGPPQTFAVSSRPNSVAVGDFNRDGLLDLVTTDGLNNNISVLLNTSTPEHSTAVMPPATAQP